MLSRKQIKRACSRLPQNLFRISQPFLAIYLLIPTKEAAKGVLQNNKKSGWDGPFLKYVCGQETTNNSTNHIKIYSATKQARVPSRQQRPCRETRMRVGAGSVKGSATGRTGAGDAAASRRCPCPAGEVHGAHLLSKVVRGWQRLTLPQLVPTPGSSAAAEWRGSPPSHSPAGRQAQAGGDKPSRWCLQEEGDTVNLLLSSPHQQPVTMLALSCSLHSCTHLPGGSG